MAGFAALPCAVLDLSSAGAEITVDDPWVKAKGGCVFADARTAELRSGLRRRHNPGVSIRP